MNLNGSLSYQLNESKRSILVFYLVVFSILLLALTASLLFAGKVNIRSNMNGIEGATIVFLFVAGMNSFRETFRMSVQNSISRKTMFAARLICTGIIGVGMALIDKMIASGGKLIQPFIKSFAISSLFETVYRQRYGIKSDGFQVFFEGLLFTACIYITIWMLGYFISVLYYRMGKGAKIAVSVGVPVSLFVLLPLLDGFAFQGELSRAFARFLAFAFGFSNKVNPYMGIISLLLLFAAFGGISWLLIRKAAVKD